MLPPNSVIVIGSITIDRIIMEDKTIKTLGGGSNLCRLDILEARYSNLYCDKCSQGRKVYFERFGEKGNKSL